MRIALAAILTTAAFGQSFDVATIKPAPPRDGHPIRVGCSGGPGTKDPGLYSCENNNLLNLICNAYDISHYQLAGAELGRDMFNVTARVPEGATKEQFRTMLQSLLVERFKLAVHRENKEVQVYGLVVARSGPKVKQSGPAAPGDGPSAIDGGRPRLDKNGYPILTGSTSMAIMNGKARARWTGMTLEKFATMLALQVGKPVNDATGLKGNYDIELSWGAGGGRNTLSADVPSPDADSEPDIFAALQEQLGLKLEPKKGSVEMLVVDHIEKAPTEN